MTTRYFKLYVHIIIIFLITNRFENRSREYLLMNAIVFIECV